MGKIAKLLQNIENDGNFVSMLDQILTNAQPEVKH